MTAFEPEFPDLSHAEFRGGRPRKSERLSDVEAEVAGHERRIAAIEAFLVDETRPRKRKAARA